jgi:hypothetical protein
MNATSIARVCAVAALLGAAAVGAQKSEQDRVRVFASLPNWTGYWIADDGVENVSGVSGRTEHGGADFVKMKLAAPMPYTAEFAAKADALRKSLATSDTGKECGFPFPFMMESPWVLQFLITPEETDVIVAGREIRHIYTDGRAHPSPDDVWPTPWGDSVGKWEGHVLAADTIAVKSGVFPPIVSERARYTERIRMVSPDRIEDELTVEDPVALTKPWKVTIPYQRVAGLDRMVHGDCNENDRNPVVDGKLTIAPAN